MRIPCRVAIIAEETFGKFPKATAPDQVVMEYKHFYNQLANYIPEAASSLLENERFIEYIKTYGDKKIYEFADFMMMTMPSPRTDHYSNSNFFKIQKAVTSYANEIIDQLGFFPLRIDLDVLSQMETYGTAILFLGLIFDIIILLFTTLSILLFYSLLMISVETKTFEFGVMRMVGLSKTGIINVIILQSFMYVVPAMLVGFVCSVPALILIYTIIFNDESLAE